MARSVLETAYMYPFLHSQLKEILEDSNASNLWGNDNNILHWFYDHANEGNEDASHIILFLIERRAVDVDEKILEWLLEEAELENIDAQFCLGTLYFQGRGVEKDYNKAENFLLTAAKAGVEKSFFHLGNLYKNVLHDYPKALLYFKKSLSYGEMDASLQLGQMYELGLGVEEDWKKAEHFYKKAEDEWILVPYSQYLIGTLYERGHSDFPKDLAKAITHYKESAKFKYQPAVDKLTKLGIALPEPDEFDPFD